MHHSTHLVIGSICTILISTEFILQFVVRNVPKIVYVNNLKSMQNSIKWLKMKTKIALKNTLISLKTVAFKWSVRSKLNWW